MKEDYPFKLDTPITEYQEVERNVYRLDPETQQATVERVKEKVPVTTIYTKAEPRFFTCPDGKHVWYMLDTHKHVAKCRKCQKARFLRAVYETISPEGHIIDRETKRVID